MENQTLVHSKKFWSIQNIAKQHKKKVAPMMINNNTNEQQQQQQQKMKTVQSERILTKEEQHEKSTTGLKRIMTQFSLADIYSSNMTTIETMPTTTTTTKIMDQDILSLTSSTSLSSPIIFNTINNNNNTNSNINNDNDNKSIVSTIVSGYQHQEVDVEAEKKEEKIKEVNEMSTVVDLKLWLSSLTSPIPTSINNNNNHHHQNIINELDLLEKPLPVLPIDENEDGVNINLIDNNHFKNQYCSNQLEKSSSSFKLSSLNNNQQPDILFNNIQNHKVNSEPVKEKTLHCRVIQITNISSSKEYQYELYIKMNDVTRAIQSGHLKKIEKGISADNPKEQLSFDVDGSFSLTFTLHAKPINMTLKKMKTILSSMSIHQDTKEKVDNDGDNNNKDNDDHYQDKNKNQLLNTETTTSSFPMIGFTHLLSGNQFEAFKGKGLHRYTLTKPITEEYDIYGYKKKKRENHHLDIEIMIAFHLEEYSHLHPVIPNPFSSSLTSSSTSAIVSNSFHSQSLLNICQQGDFLALYIKDDQSSFNWARYWVTLEKKCIYLRNLQNINIETIECVPLHNLVQVYQPLEKEEKEVEEKYKIIFRQPEHGIVLIFNDYNYNDQSNIQNRKESKKNGLNNNNGKYYMYLCAENSKKATLWRTAFNVFTSVHCT